MQRRQRLEGLKNTEVLGVDAQRLGIDRPAMDDAVADAHDLGAVFFLSIQSSTAVSAILWSTA